MRYKESLERASSGVPHTARFVEVNGYAAAVWFNKTQHFPPNPYYPRWCVVFGNMPGVPNHSYFITMDGEVRENARGRSDCPLVSVETGQKVIAALVKAVHIEVMEGMPIIETACAMFVQPRSARAGIGQLKAAVEAYEGGAKKYRIYKMAHGGVTVTDWPTLFKSPDAAAEWAGERELADDLGLHEYLAVKDETTEKVIKYL